MVRTLLSLAIVTSQLIVAQTILAERAYCIPPDAVVNSPIPPIKEPAKRSPTEVTPPKANASVTPGPANLGINLGVKQPAPNPSQATPTTGPRTVATNGLQSGLLKPQGVTRNNTAPPITTAPTQYYDAALSPEELWNSEPMRAARNGVIDFSRRSAQTSPAEGEQFLSRLSKSSLKVMASWIGRYQARQADLTMGRDVEKMARQLMLDEAIDKQEAMRRAYDNVSRMRDEAAAAQEHYAFEQAQATQSIRDRRSEQQRRILGLGLIYNPLEPVLDPMSPRGYRRRVAAAMSLPGDLPAGDPGNFIRGEVGIDTGDAANGGGAAPANPAVPVTPAPAAPAPAAPAPSGE